MVNNRLNFLVFQSDKEDYVECQCDHLSIFAAQGESDDRAGYNLAFFIVCFVCLVSLPLQGEQIDLLTILS